MDYTPSQATSRDTVAEFIGSRLRVQRAALGLSQEQLARRTSPRVTRAAISQIENGLNCPKVMVLEALTRALHLDATEILEDLRQFIEQDHHAPADPERLRVEAKLHFDQGNYLEAVSAYQQAVYTLRSQVESDPDALDLLLRTQINLSVALRRSGALRAARKIAEETIEQTERRPILARAYIALAAALEKMNQLKLGLVATQQAVALTDDSDRALRAQALNQQGTALFMLCRFDEAHDVYRAALIDARESGDLPHEIKILGNHGLVLARRGNTNHAIELIEQAVSLAARHRKHGAQAWHLATLAHVLLRAERLHEADDRAREALDLHPAEPITAFRAEWTRFRVDQLENIAPRNTRRLDRLTRYYRRVLPVHAAPEIEEFRAFTGLCGSAGAGGN
ncbi:hypothetical protein ABI59_15410 [Acidobacteria bacterium Mor1]|nr:hypothetical protein ABI59_15410 [Acidobacteria bacterium Mor1]